MRNYDEMRTDDDRTFVIRGETFKIRDVSARVMDQMTTLEEEFRAKETPTYSDISNLAEAKLLLLIDPADDGPARFQALSAREEDPVTYKEVIDISRWAFEIVSGFPTRLLAASETGAGSNDTSSTAG